MARYDPFQRWGGRPPSYSVGFAPQFTNPFEGAAGAQVDPFSQFAQLPPYDPQAAAQARANVAAGNLADMNNVALPMDRRLYALSSYLINSGTAGPVQQRIQQMQAALAGAAPDLRAEYIRRVNPEWASAGQNPFAQQADGIDIYNPGPGLAERLRQELPGYVQGRRVADPNQIRLRDWVNLTPTQQQLLLSFWSALGVPPEDALREMQMFWFGGPAARRVVWR